MILRYPNPARWGRPALATLALVLFCGCSAPQPVFPPVDPPILWPSSGDIPRYAWVGSLEGEKDLKAPRSLWSRFVALWAGSRVQVALERPSDVAVSDGVLYVSDRGAGLVHRFDIKSRKYKALTDAGGGRSFEVPLGLWTDSQSVFVADRTLGSIAVLAPDGTPRDAVGTGLLGVPVDVAVGPLSGRIYVADIDSHEIKVLEADGEPVLKFGGRGTGRGEFNYPTHVACDQEERIYVTDSMNCRIQVFDRGGRFLRTWGHRGVAPGSFSRPKGLACDPAGRVYVVDSHFENVQVFDSNGALLLAFGEEGSGPGEFWLPVGVFADDAGLIWVADSFNQRIQVFRYLGHRQDLTGDAGAVRAP